MNSRIPLLGGLVLAQLMIIAVLYMSGNEPADEAWLSVDTEQVTEIQITDGESAVTVNRADDDWQVQGYPADESKIDEVLHKLESMQAAWPVATSSDSQQRFEVADDNYQRRLAVKAGEDTVVDLFLGTSPGYQRVHARQAESDDIFSIALSNYELPLSADGWLDKGQLAVSEELTEISVQLAGGDAHNLRRGEEGWLYDDVAANQAEASAYANRFRNLRVLNTATEEDWQSAEMQAEIDLKWVSGEQTLNIARLDEEYLVGRPVGKGQQYFKIATYIAEQLLLTDVDLTVEPEEPVGDDLAEPVTEQEQNS